MRPYRYGFVVSIGQSDEELKADMRRIDRKQKTRRTKYVMAASATPGPGFCVMFENDSFMRIREIPRSVEGDGVVIHELLHVVRHCLKSRGINMSGTNGQEAYCYLLEEAWNEVMGRVVIHLKKSKQKV